MIKRIVLTGGPNGGKTTALQIIKEIYGKKVEVVKEAATMIYSGGFPRKDGNAAHTYHAQRIIFYITRELEALAEEVSDGARLVVCDRGTLDGAVYWPYGKEDFLKKMNTTMEEEFKRYHMIIHLSPPTDESFYQTTVSRTEDIEGAWEIDKKILDIWAGHPNRIVIDKRATYFEKAKVIKEIISKELGD